jgi:hypothetical protein
MRWTRFLCLNLPIGVALLSFSAVTFGQSSRIPLDKSFIDKTIEYYYSTQAKQQKGSSVFYVEKDSLTMHARADYPTFRIQFLSAAEGASTIPAVRKQEVKLDKLIIRWVSLDTIDVMINGCTIGKRKINSSADGKQPARTENFLTNCSKAYVDIPTCRFVYDPITTKWNQLNRGKDLK